jgi:hypothetical protein
MITMNGLRVFINPPKAEALSDRGMFYTRRADGPLYCWRFEDQLGAWRGSRVHNPDLTLKALCTTPWKAVPPALQAQLVEHYLD